MFFLKNDYHHDISFSGAPTLYSVFNKYYPSFPSVRVSNIEMKSSSICLNFTPAFPDNQITVKSILSVPQVIVPDTSTEDRASHFLFSTSKRGGGIPFFLRSDELSPNSLWTSPRRHPPYRTC